LQDTWDINERVKLESGLRVDNVDYGNSNFSRNQTFFLPRISALFKIDTKWSSRVGGGLGYKIPIIFTEQTETSQYQNVLPLQNVTAERSVGGTADVNFKTNLTESLVMNFNQMLFYTQIDKPLILQSGGNATFFLNAAKPVVSNGFETNVKFIYKEDFKLFVGYTFTDAKAKYLAKNQFLPLLGKNKLNLG
jgi:outer membrane receptor protein involved in Fe transport